MKAWKKEEQRVAEAFGWRRRHCSGSDAITGKSDVVMPDGRNPPIFIEVKSWKRMPLIKHIAKTIKNAKDENRQDWVLVIHEKGSHRRFAITDLSVFARIYKGEVNDR